MTLTLLHTGDPARELRPGTTPAWPAVTGTAGRPAPGVGGPGAAGMKALTGLFGLLADETRLRIVLLLRDGERNVTDLCATLNLPQPTVSHHLGQLRMGSVVAGRRQGKSVYYSLGGRTSADGREVLMTMPSGCHVGIGRSVDTPEPQACEVPRSAPLLSVSLLPAR